MRRMERPEIAQFLEDKDPRLVAEAARAINDVPILGAMPKLAEYIPNCACDYPEELRAQILSRAINANYRQGTTRDFGRVVNFIMMDKAPELMRAEALNAIAEWETPSPLDRVNGMWRPHTNRTASVSREGLAPVLEHLLREVSSEPIQLAAVRCIQRLEIKDLSPALLKQFGKPGSSSALRVQILQALGALQTPQLSRAVELSLNDGEPTVRAEGIRWAGKLNPTDAAPLLEKLLATEKDVVIGQAVYSVLGQIKDPAADAILERQLEALLRGTIRPELQLDLLEAARSRAAAPIISKLKQYDTAHSASDKLAAHRPALFGGNKENGKKLFNERDDLGCLRCHAIKGKGGVVGPDLAGVATRLSREKLLESILFPNDAFTLGFENALITIKGGAVYAGLVKTETETELVLHSPEDGDQTIKKADMEKRERGLSAMPDGLGALMSQRDLRDLIEYLASLK